MTTASKKSSSLAKNDKPDSPLAIVSLVLGVVSLTGPGLLLGIPAIITASIALKQNLGGRGLSIAGLVTGIVSTVISLLFIALIVFLVILGANWNDGATPQAPPSNNHLETEQPFSNSKT